MDKEKAKQLIASIRELGAMNTLVLIVSEMIGWEIAVPNMDDGDDNVPGMIIGQPEYIKILNENLTEAQNEKIRELGKRNVATDTEIN